MSEKDTRVATIPFQGVQQDTRQPTGKGVVAEAVKIHAPVAGDRKAYRQTMEAYKIAILGGAPMNPNNIIGAAEQRGDPIATMETDGSILKSAVGIKDYPDGSFMGVFNDGQRMMISGQLQSPEVNIPELTPGSTQVIPVQKSLVENPENTVQKVDVVKGIMVTGDQPANLDTPASDPQLPNGLFYRPLTQEELDLANRKN